MEMERLGMERLVTPGFNISVFDDLDHVSAEWPRGPQATGDVLYHPFQSVTFLKVWLASFGRSGSRSLHFVEVRDAELRPVIFMPLCISRRNGTRILGFVDGEAADYNAPVLFPTSISWTAEAADHLWKSILKALPPFDLLQLEKMPADIEGRQNPLSLLCDQSEQISCHGNDLRRPWSEIEAAIPQRRTLMRKMRNLERLAPLTFRIATGHRDRREATAAFIRQKQWRFEQTRVPGFDVDTDKRDFFRNGTDVFADEEMLKLFTLMSGDRIIATIWGLTAGKRYYAIMLSFEAGEWAKFSPGSILYHHTMQWLHENGYEWLDLGIGDEAWKLQSCETTFPLMARQSAVTLQGHAYLVRTRIVSAIRSTSLWQMIRPLKWIVLRRLRQSAMTVSGYSFLPELFLPVMTMA
jgi:CelD/BcsL family acetyltransferase involved in cellulose biosynthesis